MKLLIVLSVIAFAAAHKTLSDEERAKLEKIKDQCLPETGAAPDVLDKFIAGDFKIQDRPTKCFAKCFYQKAGFFDKDNNLDLKASIEKVTKDFGAENAEKWITACKDIKHEDPCDKAYEMFQCFYKHKHAHD